MKRLAATALALGAAVAFATPANAATSTLHLYSNYQPTTIKVNGKAYEVNGGYDTTPVKVTTGKVSLSAPKYAWISDGVCGVFDSWSDGNRSLNRSLTVSGSEAFIQTYYTRGAC